ncbi:MAG: hypothetical protein ABJH04_11325 [Cyclobacteriaceae bacterium]
MQLKTRVKVGNITNLSDARYCAGMGVDLLGFPIGDADGQISFSTFQEIAEWVVGPEFILEYVDTMDEDEFQKVTQSGSIQHIQLNFAQLQKLSGKLGNLHIVLKTSIEEWNDIHTQLSTYTISYLVLEESKTPEWKKVEEINSSVHVLIPQRFIPDIDAVNSLPISGIVLEGSSEDKPGQKDYDHLATVLESLEVY